jgi:hypothetical protein
MEKAGIINKSKKEEKRDINTNKKFKKLKCQAARKQRAKKKLSLTQIS